MRRVARPARHAGRRVPLRPGVRRRVQQPGAGAGTRPRPGGRPAAPGPHPPGGGPDRLPARAAGQAARPARRCGRVRDRGGGPGRRTRRHPLGRHHLSAARAAVHVRALPRRVRRAGDPPPGPDRNRLPPGGRLAGRGGRSRRHPAADGPGPAGPAARLRLGGPAHPRCDVVRRRAGRRGYRGGSGGLDPQPAGQRSGDLRQPRVRVPDPGRVHVPGQRAHAAETQPLRPAGAARRGGHADRPARRAARHRPDPVGADRQLAVRLRRGRRGDRPGRPAGPPRHRRGGRADRAHRGPRRAGRPAFHRGRRPRGGTGAAVPARLPHRLPGGRAGRRRHARGRRHRTDGASGPGRRAGHHRDRPARHRGPAGRGHRTGLGGSGPRRSRRRESEAGPRARPAGTAARRRRPALECGPPGAHRRDRSTADRRGQGDRGRRPTRSSPVTRERR